MIIPAIRSAYYARENLAINCNHLLAIGGIRLINLGILMNIKI